ncbi:MAG: amino acid adenylation domain-containing protein [bacterium]|nr:amino acid adenylation domain-containing protein [bacterium]
MKKSEERDYYPASLQQQGVYLQTILEPDHNAWNTCNSWCYKGVLHLETFKKAVLALIDRHPSLRCNFRLEKEQIVQKIYQTPRSPNSFFTFTDLSSNRYPYPVEKKIARARCIEKKEANRIYDLAVSSLIRFHLVRFSHDHHLLIVGKHHIITDVTSRQLLKKELAALYNAYVSRRSHQLEQTVFQYHDYALWQQEFRTSPYYSAQRNYWLKELSGTLPVVTFPLDFPRQKKKPLHIAAGETLLDVDSVSTLRTFALRNRVSFSSVFLLSFYLLLYKYSGRDDMVIGTLYRGRNSARKHLSKMIGLFANPIPIRLNMHQPVTADATLKELLGYVDQKTREAYDNQDFLFEELLRTLHPHRTDFHPPVFQVLFNMIKAPEAGNTFHGLTPQPWKEIRPDNQISSQYDLTIFIKDDMKDIAVKLLYCRNLFREETIQRMLIQYKRILSCLTDRPREVLSCLDILSPEERHRVLETFNDTAREYPSGKTIHQLFEEQAQRTPERIALHFNGFLTYRELNRQAGHVARLLMERAAGDGIVALMAERSMEMVSGMLGILKAGSAYLSIDPDYPQERIDFMLEDSGAAVVISSGVPCSGPPHPNATKNSPISTSSSSGPACIMYTSGSTGRPKGTVISHRAVVRLVCNNHYVDFSHQPSVLQMAPVSFDASTFELWGPLLNGGRCILFPGRDIDIPTLGTILRKHCISILWLTSALFNTVLDESPPVLTPVRQLAVGGEALSVLHVRRALEHLPRTRLINGYGPTEGTTFTCTYPIPPSLPADTASIPIGRPIANTRVYILDSHSQPVPIGAAGELVIAGDGLALGYLNQPELTMEKFEKRKFELYKTGDLARWLPDGNIQFLGRSDRQMKIRGFRIEPGEIERILKMHPTVSNAIVTCREESPCLGQLEAYVTTPDGCTTEPDELRDFLRQKLPGFMVPAQFATLDAFPLTPNGKVDYNALPEPVHISRSCNADTHCIAPRDDLERQLVKFWQTLLRVESIGIRDNFFDLGGYSLLAVRLFHRIEISFGKKLPVSTLFHAPTVETLAALLRKGESPFSSSSLVLIRPGGSKPPFFFMHHAEGGVLDYRELALRIESGHPIYGVHAKPDGQTLAVYKDIKQAARYYAEIIKTAAGNGPIMMGGHSFGGIVALETASLLVSQGKTVALLAIIETRAPGTRRLPGNKVLRFQLRTYLERCKFHCLRLLHMPWKKRWGYALMKLTTLFVKVNGHLKPYSGRLGVLGSGKPPVRTGGNANLLTLLAGSGFIREGYPGKITLFKASIQLPTYQQEDYGWSQYACGGVEVYVVKGEHGNLIKDPYAVELSQKLNRCIRHIETARDSPGNGEGDR